jgi:hypothetical protein
MGLQPTGQTPGRNDPCPCDSGLKYKYCHGDESKRVIANRVANLKMCELILAEQKKRGLVPYQWTCNNCNHGFDKPAQGQTSDLPLCPECDSTDIKEIETKSEEK